MTGPIQTYAIAGLIAVGCVFLTVGTIGLLRFDTVYNRMHATSKPTTLGVAAIFLASALYFGPGGAALPSLLAVVFLFLTIPTGTHMMARAAERMGVPFREGVTWPEPPGADERSSGRDGTDGATDTGAAGSEASEAEAGTDRATGADAGADGATEADDGDSSGE